MKKVLKVVAALIRQDGRFLICQRPQGKARAMQWEFVGGKVEPGETDAQALARECSEELAIEVAVGDKFFAARHEYDDVFVDLTLYNATITRGTPQLLEHNDLRWIYPHEVDNFDFCPADKPILQKLQQLH